MSQVSPTFPEPVSATPRRGMTPAMRKAILEKQGPLCLAQGCERPWIEVDHRVPLALGGLDTLDNWEGLCGAHHLGKTLLDVKAIAKAKRLSGETGHGYKRPIGRRENPWPKGSRKLQSRGFR